MCLAALATFAVAAQAGPILDPPDKVSVFVDGQQVSVETKADTVDDVLGDLGVDPEGAENVVPELEENIEDGSMIIVESEEYIQALVERPDPSPEILLDAIEVEAEKVADERAETARIAAEKAATKVFTVQVNKEISFSKKSIADRTMMRGTSKIAQKGVTGKSYDSYRVTTKWDKEVSREALGRTIVSQPQDEIVRYGTKQELSTRSSSTGSGSSPGTGQVSNTISMKASAYWASFGSGKTASGTKARRGVVAVDPSVIPLGTKLYIEGYGYAVAEDTGGAIKGNRIDLCFATYNEAVQFGRQTVTVKVLK